LAAVERGGNQIVARVEGSGQILLPGRDDVALVGWVDGDRWLDHEPGDLCVVVECSGTTGGEGARAGHCGHALDLVRSGCGYRRDGRQYACEQDKGAQDRKDAAARFRLGHFVSPLVACVRAPVGCVHVRIDRVRARCECRAHLWCRRARSKKPMTRRSYLRGWVSMPPVCE